ncbi:DEAD/DEAH box helicase [Pseudoalteromonas shioyasakiensis]|nr:DEAD/DEAH box helicase [Pseudoalteromonas shioyasakiensis]
MVDFNKLRNQKKIPKAIEPLEIFRRLPKPIGINDLYTSQAEVLKSWFSLRNQQDVVIKLHTGGGKTLVGLLMAQSALNETSEPVLYLAPTTQLVNQTIEKAKSLGIHAVPYEKGKPLNDDFINANSLMVGTYKALFNGKSKFGIRGSSSPQNVGTVILDDAHAAFSVVRDSFTLEIKKDKHLDIYNTLSDLFRKAFDDIEKLGTFDDVRSGNEFSVLEVPYWSWHQKLNTVREILKENSNYFALVWPLLRDNLHLCHALISKDSFTITAILPLTELFPSFSNASRRIYMSATIADDSDIIRMFNADPRFVENPLTSRSLAGISERMILIPDLMNYSTDLNEVNVLLDWAKSNKLGSVVLTSSDRSADKWKGVGTVAKGSKEVESMVESLQLKQCFGPAIFANRYDGIDLPGDSCRLLVMSGLPSGTSNYELFRASSLFGGKTITKMLAQRIEQGVGRGARGAGDYCVVIMVGSDLAAWIAKKNNFKYLTNATRAQLQMGAEISSEVSSFEDLATTIHRSIIRDQDWVEYHAETLADLVGETVNDSSEFIQASGERKAFNLWYDGYPDKAISRIEKVVDSVSLDPQIAGWLQQFSARIADKWGHTKRAEELQRIAYGLNRNLMRPKVLPPYRPAFISNLQADVICDALSEYRLRRGLIQSFEDTVASLNKNASANQFEQALSDIAKQLGFYAERHDDNGEGPDVLWLLPNNIGLVIEAKSRKKAKNALTKDEHGQLLVAAEWFAKHYPGYKCIRVSVHPENIATKAAVAGASHAFTYINLAKLIDDLRVLLQHLIESQLSGEDLKIQCNHLLSCSPLNAENFVGCYLEKFTE